MRTQKRLWTLCLMASMLAINACKKDHVTEPVNQCASVAAVGQLAVNSSGDTYTYRTTGGGIIRLEISSTIALPRLNISHESYPGLSYEFWGDTTINGRKTTSANHENLNGKHIKDRIATRRTIMFPDGAKITMIADGRQGPLISLSIYDGVESHRINLNCFQLVHSSTDQTVARKLDNEEADGETAGFEITSTGLILFNSYTEDAPGVKTGTRVNLGEIFRVNPNQVNDYFDDPSLQAT